MPTATNTVPAPITTPTISAARAAGGSPFCDGATGLDPFVGVIDAGVRGTDVAPVGDGAELVPLPSGGSGEGGVPVVGSEGSVGGGGG